jgi:hypothetical protein
MKKHIPSKELRDFVSNYSKNVHYIMLNACIVPHTQHLIENPPKINEECEIPFSVKEIKEAWDYFQKKVSPEEFNYMVSQDYIKRDIELFEYYLTQMLFRVFVEKPNTLKSSEKIEIGEVLESKNLNEVVQKIAVKKVNDLSYSGLEGIIDFLNNKLGLGYDKNSISFRKAKELIEVRNIITHNQGLVNSQFVRRAGRKDIKIGDRFPLSTDYAIEAANRLEEVVINLDKLFLSHFKLSP